jgi:L-alanine-DL-glutamate epimerase-like enolase superfamily enzyme
MKDLIIESAEVFVVGPETERYAWALDMPEQFMTNTILRLRTKGGLEGIAGGPSYTDYDFDRAVAENLRPLLPKLIGASPVDREAIWGKLFTLTLPYLSQTQSIIDVALWDLAAKAAGLPLYQFLGGARDKILSYASTPLLADAQAYVDFVAQLREEGFQAIKFHCWCELGRDMTMVRAVQKRFGDSGLALMLDVEQRYDRQSAMKAARELSELGYRWFEAPLIDFDLEGYRLLRQSARVPIIPAGNSILDLRLLELAASLGCWSDMRIDVLQCGGFTPARKAMGLAAARGMNVELQCWGYTLTQAANLHLMLAYDNCTYFEQPSPYPAFEYGSLDVIRTDRDGYVHAPPGPGLGIGIDWPAIEKATIDRYVVGKGA